MFSSSASTWRRCTLRRPRRNTPRLAQRGVAVAALLRAYRIGSARFQDWCLQELGRRTDNAAIISAAGCASPRPGFVHRQNLGRGRIRLRIREGELASEPERGQSGPRPCAAEGRAGGRGLLRGHPGLSAQATAPGGVAWITGAAAGGDVLGRLEQATKQMAADAHCDGQPMFVPQDEVCAWAWMPLGVRRDIAACRRMGAETEGGGTDPVRFRRTRAGSARDSAALIGRR